MDGATGVCTLGIDVGLSGVKAAVLSADGRLLGFARRPNEANVSRPGRAEQDPRSWVAGALAAGREAIAQAGLRGVAAVGVGALGPAPILVDRSLEALTPALLFSLDTRAEVQRARLAADLGLADSDLTHDHALPKLFWWRETEPALWRRAAVALDATGFVVAALTGQPAMDSITAAGYRLPGLESPLPIPQPVDPLAIAGGLRPGPARALGLLEGTPVAAGAYDTYVDVAGTGAGRPGDACILLGSTLAVYRVVSAPIECSGLELTPYPGEGLLLGGTTATAGAALTWFRRELGATETLDETVAGLEPGAGGLLALPYLAGERTPIRDPNARGVIVGVTLATRREHVYRALVDSLALSALDHLARLAQVGKAPDTWLVSGGGVRDRAWLHATCDALGAPLAVAAHAGEAVGPAVVAFRAVGADPDLRPTRTVEPDAGRKERFDALYAHYRELHPLLAKTMHRLGELEAKAS